MMAGIVRCFNRVGLYYKAFKRMPFLQWPQRDSYQLYFFQKKSKLLTTGELGLKSLRIGGRRINVDDQKYPLSKDSPVSWNPGLA